MEEKAVGATAVGTVKWFDERKGYGFMVVADTEPVQQLFMHSSVLPRKRDAHGEVQCALRRGDGVEVVVVERNGRREVGQLLSHTPREGASTASAREVAEEERLLQRVVGEVAAAQLLLAAAEAPPFAEGADRLLAAAAQLPHRHELVRGPVFAALQVVDRSVARAASHRAVHGEAARLYERALAAEPPLAFSKDQREALSAMLQVLRTTLPDEQASTPRREGATAERPPRPQGGDARRTVLGTRASVDPCRVQAAQEVGGGEGCTGEAAGRLRRTEAVLGQRTTRFVLVLEAVADVTNRCGIFRTAEALGVHEVWVVLPAKLRVTKGSVNAVSKKAQQWLVVRHFASTSECVAAARSEGRAIWVTHLHAGAEALVAPLACPERWVRLHVPSTRAVLLLSVCCAGTGASAAFAIVMGSEHDGVSNEFVQAADKVVCLPMFGFTESLNVMVATALVVQRLFDLCSESARGDLTEAQRAAARARWTPAIRARLPLPSEEEG